MMYLAHKFQRPLESDFTVVQWDRRGAGKTYHRNKPTPNSMNVRQLLDDTYVLIDTLMKRYNHRKVVLVGHSFGTYLGSLLVSEHPELFSAYLSIGQVVDPQRSRALKEGFVRRRAAEEGRDDIVTQLNKNDLVDLENWLFEFGGELKNHKSFWPLVWTGMQAPEYTLREVLDVADGSSFSSRHMKYNVIDGSIYDEVRNYNVPVYFLVGQNDYTTPHELIKEYYETVTAPKKEFHYFEDSAHYPFYEEPKKFCEVVKHLLSK
jgi:pimeloyl-ACP methyl ester carboxylesterase